MNQRFFFLLAAMAAMTAGCAVDTRSDDDSAVEETDETPAPDDEQVEPCDGHGGTLYWDRYWRDQDGDGCLSAFEHDNGTLDTWFSRAYCADGTWSSVAPAAGSGFLLENDICPPEEPDEKVEEECDDDLDNDQDGDVDCLDSDCEDEDVCDEDEGDDDDDDTADDDDSTAPPAPEMRMVTVYRDAFNASWTLSVYNWSRNAGNWWNFTSPSYCAQGSASATNLSCSVWIQSGDRFSVNGEVSGGSWLVTASGDSVSWITVSGTLYPLTRTRSTAVPTGPWSDIPAGTCRYSSTSNPGGNDFWCVGL